MDGIPALRYGPPDDFLDNARDNPNNTCFSTPSYTSLPSGVLLNGPCFMGEFYESERGRSSVHWSILTIYFNELR